MGDLPRRVRDDDPTRSPLYLLQRRKLVPTWEGLGDLEYDHDRECWIDPTHGDRVDSDGLVSRGVAEWAWHTIGVYFTREECDAYCRRRSYNGPFRSYSAPAEGELEKLIHMQTDPREVTCG